MSKTPCTLLDVNVLLAAAWPSHQFHAATHAWLAQNRGRPWATCALTELGFVRLSSNTGIFADAASPARALEVLRHATAQKTHVYWQDCPPPDALPGWPDLVITGHRQVTDGYLLAITMHHRGRLATFDRGMAELLVSASERKRWVELLPL